MSPTSNQVIEILIKLSEINSRKMRNLKKFYRSRKTFLYYEHFEEEKTKQKNKS